MSSSKHILPLFIWKFMCCVQGAISDGVFRLGMVAVIGLSYSLEFTFRYMLIMGLTPAVPNT